MYLCKFILIYEEENNKMIYWI